MERGWFLDLGRAGAEFIHRRALNGKPESPYNSISVDVLSGRGR